MFTLTVYEMLILKQDIDHLIQIKFQSNIIRARSSLCFLYKVIYYAALLHYFNAFVPLLLKHLHLLILDHIA